MSIDTDIEESMRLAAEQQALATGERLEAEAAAQEEAVFTRAREAQEAELAQLPEKYRGKTAAEVYQLVKAEQEYLAKKAKEGDTTEEEEPTTEEAPAPAEEEETEAAKALREASEELTSGKLSPETIAKLEALPSAELIKAWQALQEGTEPPLSEEEAVTLVKSVGGQEVYNEALKWAAENLSDEDKASYDQVIKSGNRAATRFAVEALLNRYKASEGFDGSPVSGGRTKTQGIKPYRSNAELRRDLANSRYQEDPAFRLDVENRLAVSGELLD